MGFLYTSKFIRAGGPADQCREDSQHGLPDFPGGGDTFGGSIREKDDGGGTNIPGAAERTGTVRGMQEGYGGEIVGVPQGDTAWAGGKGAVYLGSLVHGMRTADVLDGLHDQGMSTELTNGGLPRTCREEDRDADALLKLECPVYPNHLGGGKLPPPKVLTMQHSGPMEGIKW